MDTLEEVCQRTMRNFFRMVIVPEALQSGKHQTLFRAAERAAAGCEYSLQGEWKEPSSLYSADPRATRRNLQVLVEVTNELRDILKKEERLEEIEDLADISYDHVQYLNRHPELMAPTCNTWRRTLGAIIADICLQTAPFLRECWPCHLPLH